MIGETGIGMGYGEKAGVSLFKEVRALHEFSTSPLMPRICNAALHMRYRVYTCERCGALAALDDWPKQVFVAGIFFFLFFFPSFPFQSLLSSMQLLLLLVQLQQQQ